MAAGEEARLLEEGLGAAAVGLQVGTPLNHRGQQGRAFDREEDDEHTQTGSALWLALAGGHHRVTAVISKAKLVGGKSSVVLSKHHRAARKTA